MRSFSIAVPKDKIEIGLAEALALDPTALLVFAGPTLLRDPASVQLIKDKLKGRPFIGCSTAGEIAGSGLHMNSLSVLALRFDQVDVRTVHERIEQNTDSFEAGKKIASTLKGDNLRFVFTLLPGTNMNGSAFIEGMTSVLGDEVVISGGVAGDNEDFRLTHTLCEGELYSDHAVAMGFYGDTLVVSCSSEGGWRPFGPARKVTKADQNLLLELDGKPALQLYRQYLGDKARMLPASGLSYPFAILRNDRSTSGVIRSALGIDPDHEALIMAGNVPQGCQVCLMHADTDALTQGAAQAAAEVLRTHAGPEENGCGLLVSCVGRRLVYGLDAEEEIEAVTDSFLPGTTICGFYSYGEICSYTGTGRVEFHNQTMTITYLTERTPST